MLTKSGVAITFYAMYIASKVGKTALTVTVDVYEATTTSPIVSGGSATELAGGLYYYTLASGSVDASGAYIAVFRTTDATVDSQHIPAIWITDTTIKADAVQISGSSVAADSVEANIANLDVAVSSVAGGVTVNATVAISATDAAVVASGALALRTYHTFAQAITSTSTAALGTATKVWLALKLSTADADSASIVFIEAAAGLTVLAGTAYVTAAHGTLAVGGSSGAWTITLGLDEAAMALLGAYVGGLLEAEVKALVGANTVAVWSGTAQISAGIVRAVA